MKIPYTCVRCGYTSDHKNAMKKHLYEKKKPCPSAKADVELTDDIKECILENRVYHLPKSDTVINQTINNYNTMNNFIASMDNIEKLTKLMCYKNVDIMDFERSIEAKYETKAKRLEQNTYRDFQLDRNDLYDIVNDVCKICEGGNFNDMNIFYDTKFDELKLYESGTWENMLLEQGIKKLVSTIQGYYLDNYEIYLIRRMRSDDVSSMDKNAYKERLREYYKFINSFDLNPCIKGKNDHEIMYNTDDNRYYEDCDTFEIEDEFLPLFNSTSDKITKSEMKRIKSDVVEIIKRNSKKNIFDLNKNVIALFNMEEGFKELLLSSCKR